MTALRLRWIILTGVAIRLLLIPLTSETYDVSVWWLVSVDMLKGLGIYASHTYTYPPLYAFSFLPFVKILSFLVNPSNLAHIPNDLASLGLIPGTLQPVASPLFLVAVKIPLLIADLGGAYVTFRIVHEFAGISRAKAALALWLLNPAVIWTSFGHGQYDMIPAVLTLISCYLLFRKHFFSAGIALGLGVLFKLYPLFLLPLYLVLAAEIGPHSHAGGRLRRISRLFAGLAVPGILFGVIPLVIPEMGGGFLGLFAERENLIASLGGFSPFSIVSSPQLANLKNLLVLNSQIVNSTIIPIQFVLSFLIAWRTRKRASEEAFAPNLYGHVFTITMVFLTSLVVNPQYLVWIMPFLTLLYGLKGEYLKRTWILSILSILFNLIWLGLGYFLYPAAIFLGAPSVAFLTMLNKATATISFPALQLCQIAGFVTIVSLFKPRIGSLPVAKGFLNASREIHLDPKLPVRMETALELSLLFLIGSMAFVAVNGIPPVTVQPSLNVIKVTQATVPTMLQTIIQTRFFLHLTGGTYPARVNTLLVPATQLTIPPVYVYYDPTYPTSLTDLRGWTGILDHLRFELSIRNYPNPSIATVNGTQLAQLLEYSNGSVIIMPSGVLPSTTNATMMKSYLQRGGAIFWSGDRVGYYSSAPGTSLNQNSLANPGYNAQLQLFNGYILSENQTSLSYSPTQRYPPYTVGTQASELSGALNLQYPDTVVGVNLENLTKVSGFSMGLVNRATNQTSIAVIPVGIGKMVIFGGGVTSEFASSGETEIAYDIAQILGTGILYSTFQVGFFQEYLSANQNLDVNYTIYTNVAPPLAAIILVSYSPEPYIAFFVSAPYAGPYPGSSS